MCKLAGTLHEARKTKERKVDLDACVNYVLDTITALGHADLSLNIRRREVVKPIYRPLCFKQVPITNFLFGDDVTKSVKDILKEINQVARKLGDRVCVCVRERERERERESHSRNHNSRFSHQHQRYGKGKFNRKLFSRQKGQGHRNQGHYRKRKQNTDKEQN